MYGRLCKNFDPLCYFDDHSEDSGDDMGSSESMNSDSECINKIDNNQKYRKPIIHTETKSVFSISEQIPHLQSESQFPQLQSQPAIVVLTPSIQPPPPSPPSLSPSPQTKTIAPSSTRTTPARIIPKATILPSTSSVATLGIQTPLPSSFLPSEPTAETISMEKKAKDSQLSASHTLLSSSSLQINKSITIDILKKCGYKSPNLLKKHTSCFKSKMEQELYKKENSKRRRIEATILLEKERDEEYEVQLARAKQLLREERREQRKWAKISKYKQTLGKKKNGKGKGWIEGMAGIIRRGRDGSRCEH